MLVCFIGIGQDVRFSLPSFFLLRVAADLEHLKVQLTPVKFQCYHVLPVVKSTVKVKVLCSCSVSVLVCDVVRRCATLCDVVRLCIVEVLLQYLGDGRADDWHGTYEIHRNPTKLRFDQ